ncbi:hypothetical protein ACFLFF_30265 [Brevibacillus reuszeri]|uniref:hypothetical protein n=1 Tax=Brevibacillus reuszeri TaxID=54915 RepID=UPI0036713D8A
MDKIDVIAKFGYVSKQTKRHLSKTIQDVQKKSDDRICWKDEMGVGYCVSYNGEETTLCVSVSDMGDEPNASVLPYLTDELGDPFSMFASPSSLNPDVMIFYMFWNFRESNTKQPVLH